MKSRKPYRLTIFMQMSKPYYIIRPVKHAMLANFFYLHMREMFCSRKDKFKLVIDIFVNRPFPYQFLTRITKAFLIRSALRNIIIYESINSDFERVSFSVRSFRPIVFCAPKKWSMVKHGTDKTTNTRRSAVRETGVSRYRGG